MNNRDTFRDFCLTQDHEEGILDISNDTLLTQIGETGIMPKNIRGKKPKRVAYASIKHVRTILDLNRVGELPPQLTIEKLGELGIPTSEVFHVKNSLQDLALIDEVGRLTPQFESLAHVSVNEYRTKLTEVLHKGYPEVFKKIPNPAQATPGQFYEAFAVYAYPKQHRKMISLFKELCRLAGLMDETETADVSSTPNMKIDASIPQETPTLDAFHSVEGETFMADLPSTPQTNGSIPGPNYAKVDERGEFLTRLLQLPKSVGWTDEDRSWWQQAVSSAISRLSEELQAQEGLKS